MNKGKIAAFVVSTFTLMTASHLSAQNTGNAPFDECVIACLAEGGGQQGDGTLCRIICAREIDFPPPGGGVNTGPGPITLPGKPGPDGCAGTRLPCRPN